MDIGKMIDCTFLLSTVLISITKAIVFSVAEPAESQAQSFFFHLRLCSHSHTILFQSFHRLLFLAGYNHKEVDSKKTFFAGLGEVIKENGWYPFIGLGAAALLTKEILLVSPEILVMTDFIALAGAGYILGAEAIETSLHKERAEYIDKVNSVFDARIEIVKAHIESCKAALALPDVVTEANAAFIEANAAAAKARDLVARQKHRDATVSQLTGLFNKEQERLNAIREAVLSKSKDYVMAQVSTPAVKSALLKEAIALVGAKEDKTGTFAAVDALITEAVKKAKASSA